MDPQSEPDFLREGGLDGVVRSWAKVRKRVICVIGSLMHLQFGNVSLSLIVSHVTERGLVCMIILRVSLKKKLSVWSSMVDGSTLGSFVLDMYRNLSTQATKKRRLLAVSTVWPSNS